MKWMIRIVACAVVMSFAMAAFAQSLGDAAREQKARPQMQKAKRVYTNEDLPSVREPAATALARQDETPAAKDESKSTSIVDREKRDDQYKMKINEAKAKIADLQREIDLMDREYKLRSAIFYSDAGNRLRDDKKWSDEERKYKDDSVKQRNNLQSAKDKLEALSEEARKAGVMGLN